MRSTPLKTFILPSISLALLATLTALACGGGYWDADEGSKFTPHIIHQKTVVPFFRTMETPFYDGYDDDSYEKFVAKNKTEWASFFENKLSDAALNYWLYDASLTQIDQMIFDIKGKASQLEELSVKHSLKNRVPAAKANAFLYYVGFARRNETIARPTDTWSSRQEGVPVANITQQIAGGLNFFTKATDVFIKERYGFQVARLYFFSKEYDKAIAFFNENEKSFSGNSMKWRSMGYKAASLYRQKKYAESNYIYSVIYDQYEPLKKSAYLSFHPLEKTEWEQCLALTKNTHEKEVLWQLSGLYHNDVAAMKEILKLNPSSELADLLAVRAVNTEEWKMDDGTDDKKTYSINKSLLAFMNETSANNKSSNPIVWHLSAAYLNYIQGDYAVADQQLKRAEKYRNDHVMNKAEYHLISAYGTLKRSPVVNEKLEADLLPDLNVLFNKQTDTLENFRSQNAKSWTRKTLAGLYVKKGEYEKAELICPGVEAKQFATTDNIKKMIAYYEKPDHSAFEKLFLQNASLQKEQYMELLGIRYAQQDKLEEAVTALKASGDKTELYGNPFTIHIKDCHDCDHEAVQKTKYTKTSFIEKLIEMKRTAKEKPAEAAQNYLLVANGFYNMSYFGNARLFYDNRVDNAIYMYEHALAPEENNELALKYYLLALQSATDKELKAKCTFMAAKCEQNAFFMNMPANYKGDFKSGIYFASLKKGYSNTKYYAEIIKECGYFKTYLRSR
jgi:hypothetical protein